MGKLFTQGAFFPTNIDRVKKTAEVAMKVLSYLSPIGLELDPEEITSCAIDGKLLEYFFRFAVQIGRILKDVPPKFKSLRYFMLSCDGVSSIVSAFSNSIDLKNQQIKTSCKNFLFFLLFSSVFFICMKSDVKLRLASVYLSDPMICLAFLQKLER